MEISIKNRELFDLIHNNSCLSNFDKKNILFLHVVQKFGLNNEETKKVLSYQLSEIFLKTLKRKFNKLHRTKRSAENFKMKEAIWLDSDFHLNVSDSSTDGKEKDNPASSRKNINKSGKSCKMFIKIELFQSHVIFSIM